MGKMKLELQFKMAADMRFREHIDKHALKRAGQLQDCAFIYSYAMYHNLLDFSDSFCNWLREKGRQHRLLKDIPAEAWNDFLEDKSAKVGLITLKNYKSRINTWEKVINAAFKTKLDWSQHLILPHKLNQEETEIKRIQQMQREDFNKIMSHITRTKSRSRAITALELSARFGLRVEGTSRIRPTNIHLDTPGLWGYGTIDITEKGNRRRIIDIKTQADREFLKSLIQGKPPDTPLVLIQKDSVNKYLNRTMTAIGIKERYPETSIHSIRKMYAQETWDNCRRQGHSWDEALRYVNRQLGHGEERNKALLGVYVKEMW